MRVTRGRYTLTVKNTGEETTINTYTSLEKVLIVINYIEDCNNHLGSFTEYDLSFEYKEVTILFKYGMRLRGFSLGSQPKDHVKWQDVEKIETGYWSYVWYERRLSDKELYQYNLDYLGEEEC